MGVVGMDGGSTTIPSRGLPVIAGEGDTEGAPSMAGGIWIYRAGGSSYDDGFMVAQSRTGEPIDFSAISAGSFPRRTYGSSVRACSPPVRFAGR